MAPPQSTSTVPAEEHSSAVEHLFRSPLPDIEIPSHLTLHEYIFEKVSQYPDKLCLLDHASGREYSYSETEVCSRRVASGLAAMGIGKGQVIMLLLPNCPEFVFLFMGASICGAVATTANPMYKPAEIHRQVKMSDTKLIITQAALVSKLAEEIGSHIPIVTVDSADNLPDGCRHFSELMNSPPFDSSEIEIHPDEVVALPFSSGTTGLPKGVMLTHRSLATSVAQQVDGDNPNLHFSPDDTILCVLPLIHIFSLNSVLLCALRAGSTIALMGRFDVASLLQLVQKRKITGMAVVPPIVLAITKFAQVDQFDLSSVRKVLCGAAPLGKELEDSFRVRIPRAVIGQGYGMTEAGPVLSMCMSFAKEPTSVKPGSCGSVVRNAQMKIVDPETGVSLPYNKPGEICIRGDQIMKGYLNDPESTTAIIDKDGWLHTGDIGYVDDDNEVFIIDRVKEIIKYKGFQVPPAELEGLLISHPLIHDAAVVPEPDEVAGEIPVAFVIKAPGAEISEDEIKKYISDQVVFYKRVVKVYFTDAIPKSGSGKILRRELRDRLAAKNLQ